MADSSIQIEFNQLDVQEMEFISELINSSVEIVNKILPLKKPIFKIISDKDRVIPEYGVSGYCPNQFSIEIIVEKGRLEDWKKYLPKTLYHEWHHLARWQGPGYGKTLMEVIISEGLAQHFEVEVTGGEPSFYTNVLTEEQRTKLLDVLAKDYDDSDYDHYIWFFGKGDFPFLAGYDISYFIIGKYLEKTNKKPSELVNLTSLEMVKFLGY